ncbi:MAG: hypothetical protein QOC81_613 [Thermoanaerobaculia bacterium]|nr:hypothetical protein [Thermoanaerobaculia bacterium]
MSRLIGILLIPQFDKERKIQRRLVIWLFVFAPATLFAAFGSEFYERLFTRGMADFRAGDYPHAYTELHTAAFGLLERVETFETAEIYAAIAANRLGRQAETRDALMRIVAAENVQPHFQTIAIPEALRTELYRAAATLLTKKEGAVLGVPEEMQNAAAKEKPPVEVPTPAKRPNVAVTAPADGGDSTKPPAEPQPVAPAPSPVPAPAVTPPDPQPVAAQPVAEPSVVVPPQTVADPPLTDTATPNVIATTPPKDESTQPATTTLQAIVPMVPPAPKPAQKSIDTRLADAQKAADDGNPARARSIYNALLSEKRLPHASALHLAEGLYRVRDFAGAIRAFKRVGAIAAGEERYHYYYAVALFETGHVGDARRELDAALPFIEVTSDVAAYRTKIEQAK